jgi:arginine repressor
MPDNIYAGFTFYGYIPENSDKQHLGIILGIKEELLKYCYCTSKFSRIINETDFIKIPSEKMRLYFTNPQDTYIFLSTRHIINMLVVTFKSKLGSEYEIKPPIDRDIYTSILSKIRNSDNLPERFKNDFFEFLE